MRFYAAMALSYLLKETVPEEVVPVFFTALTDSSPVQGVYDELPWTWADRPVQFQALAFLQWLTSSKRRDLIMRRLVELLPTVDEIVVERSLTTCCIAHSIGRSSAYLPR